MLRQRLMRRSRSTTWKTWLGTALAVWLLVAEAFAVAHQYDSVSHTNGQACAVCVSATSFGAGNVAAPISIEAVIAAVVVVVAARILFLSVVPTRRFARGPPRVSFTF